MSDIVDRLAMLAVFNPPCAVSQAMEEAADEIERLRASLRRIANGDFCAKFMSNPPVCVRAYEARRVLEERRHD